VIFLDCLQEDRSDAESGADLLDGSAILLTRPAEQLADRYCSSSTLQVPLHICRDTAAMLPAREKCHRCFEFLIVSALSRQS
jgi:hypothetical protein